MYQIITEDQQLAEHCERWQNLSCIAIDTEFVRTSTFYPIAGLIQIADEKSCYLLDPLTITDFSPLKKLLTDSSVIKILHSCSEDLDLFLHLLEELPQPIFDTQIAAAFLGDGFSMSYQRLVRHCLDKELTKEQTRSNWVQRPLSEEQCRYAALDVFYLRQVFDKQQARLKAQGKYEWLMSECSALNENALANHQIEQYYLRIKSAWKLDRRQLSVLRALCSWRETKARINNSPRGRVVKDSSLCQIALKQVGQLAGLVEIKDLSSGMIKRYGEELIAVVHEAKELPIEQAPALQPSPLGANQNRRLKEMKALVLEISKRESMVPEVLMRKKDYEALLRCDSSESKSSWLSSIAPWRAKLVGDTLANWPLI